MNGRQLSLWDNVALESGLQCLNSMELDAAIEHFNDCLTSRLGNREKLLKFINICSDWKQKMAFSSGTPFSAAKISELISDISRYYFPPEMAGLKSSLLIFISGLVPDVVAELDPESVEMLFDQLLLVEEFDKAGSIIKDYFQKFPEKITLLYLIAQAKWLGDELGEANRIYTMALLSDPVNVPLQRIKNRRLKELIQTRGAAMTPAYGWIDHILPFLPLEKLSELPVTEETHALQSYRLLQESQRALNRRDMTACINYRKQLKSLAPELYEAYFNLLKFKKTGFAIVRDPMSAQEQ
jgi:hypothetical protein